MSCRRRKYFLNWQVQRLEFQCAGWSQRNIWLKFGRMQVQLRAHERNVARKAVADLVDRLRLP